MNAIRRFMVCGAVALCACGATAAGLTEENFRTKRADGRFYAQKRCLPMVSSSGLDQIHLLVAVAGLK